MVLRRASLVVIIALAAAACGGSGTVTMPVPTPAPSPAATPPPGGFGTVTGTAFVAPSGAAAAPAGGLTRPARAHLTRPLYVPGQLLVKFRPGTAPAAANSVHAQNGATALRTIARLDVQVVRLAAGVSAESAMAAYRTSSLVEYVERDVYAYASATPNDPLYLPNQSWHYGQINLPTAWDTATGAPQIVAVIDTGIAGGHPDLAASTVPGFDFFANPDDGDPTDEGCPTVDPNDLSHGTHVAGTVAATTNNATGVAGVNWAGAAGTRIMALRVLGEIPPFCGVGSLSDVASAIIYAADRGAKTINMSLGAGLSPCMFTTGDNAITYARNSGVTLVAASGNFNTAVEYPACNANVIAVGATGNTSPPAKASYSNFGPELDVVAPGGDGAFFVWSTTWRLAGNLFAYAGFQGTSMATPHVAGLIALMISRGITGPANIQSVLQSTAIDLAPPGFDTQTGFGLVNAAAAVGGGSGPTRMCAFVGVISGSAITRQSDMVRVLASGAFTITNAQSGVKSAFVWQDIDASGTVTPGDIFGERAGVTVPSGGTQTGADVTAQTRIPGSPLLTVSPGGASACPST